MDFAIVEEPCISQSPGFVGEGEGGYLSELITRMGRHIRKTTLSTSTGLP